jgi:hypothetical protein
MNGRPTPGVREGLEDVMGSQRGPLDEEAAN